MINQCKSQSKKKLPEAEFYRWDNVDPSHPAVVHAKCAIADESRALVTEHVLRKI